MTTDTQVSTPGGAASARALDGEARVRLYETMVLSRTYEEAILREYHADKGPGFDIGKGLIPGEMHLSAGQEPVAAGVCAHLTTDDGVTATHRPHHFAIAHGMDLRKMTAEIFGRETGLGRGRGGHMHLFDPDTHFSCSGIIAEGYPPALGQAFAFKRKGTDRVVVAVTGEGAANQGAFHESLNLAAMWNAAGRLRRGGQRLGHLRAEVGLHRDPVQRRPRRGLRHPGRTGRGQRRRGGLRGCRRAVARARAGQGPTLIEVHTLRLWGHFEGDAQGYRPELAEAPAQDPIPRYEQALRDGRAARRRRGVAGSRRRRASASRTRSPSPRTAPCPTRRGPPTTCSPEETTMTITDTPRPAPAASRRLSTSKAMVEAIAQEMERDPSVVLHGRGRRRLRRHLQLHDRAARPVRAGAGHRHADLRDGLHRPRHRRGHRGHAPHRRADVRRLLRRLHRPDLQPHGQDPLRVRRQRQGAHGADHGRRRRLLRRRPALAVPLGHLRPPARA